MPDTIAFHPGESRLDRHSIWLLASGHWAVDFAQGAVPAMLPFFVLERHFSYAAAAGLVLAQTVSSSVIQPVFGRLSDRWPAPWLMPAGVLLSGLGVGLAGLLPSYGATWSAVAAGGVGVAAFHPEGARYANYASGDSRATGLSIFGVGGNIGFASAPVLATPLLIWLGLGGTWALGLAGLAVSTALAVNMARIGSHRPSPRPGSVATGRVEASNRPAAFAKLTGALLLRSVVFYGLNTFIPLFWIAELHQSRAAGGAALTTLLVVGALGNLLGGRLGERHSRPLLIGLATLSASPLIVAVVLPSNPWVAMLALVPLAIALYIPSSLMVLLGQEYLPRAVGTASGITLGLAVSVGGVVTPALGVVGDRAGLRVALLLLAVVPVLAAALALALPPEPWQRRRSGQPVP